MVDVRQLSLFPEEPSCSQSDTSSTFADNLSLPIHRWFRYSAGFSAIWVGELIATEKAKGRHKVLHPFAGSGTVLLEGELGGVQAVGIEAHPFVARVARAKLRWREDPQEFLRQGQAVLGRAQLICGAVDHYPELVRKCFPPQTLADLDALRVAWEESSDRLACVQLSWLALVSVLRDCSPVGTAQWQYVLPKKTKAQPMQPFEAFEAKIHLMYADMVSRHRQQWGVEAILHCEDVRTCSSVSDGWADLILTSPPYANNYDYADATRLEMSFLGEVSRWGDLQDVVRKHLIRSCTQHVASLAQETEALLEDPLLDPIRRELIAKCRDLEIVREQHGGKKPYHTMVVSYFIDMAQVWVALRRATSDGARVCFVVGDSAPYGVHLPVDRWLGELALAAGFKSYRFEKTRDRNVKWRNREHRLPLHEGRLEVEG